MVTVRAEASPQQGSNVPAKTLGKQKVLTLSVRGSVIQTVHKSLMPLEAQDAVRIKNAAAETNAVREKPLGLNLCTQGCSELKPLRG